MKSSLKACQSCKKSMNGGVYRASHICPHCAFAHPGGKITRKSLSQKAATPATSKVAKKTVTRKSAADIVLTTKPVVLTTKPVEDQNVLEKFNEVSSMSALNIELSADHFSNGKFIGSKSKKVQAALQQGKKDALAQLRDSATELGANMVAGITIKNAMKLVGTKQANITVKAVGLSLIADLTEDAVEA